MTQKNHEEVLELLRSLPQPGKVLLDYVGSGVVGSCLGIANVPPKMTGKNPGCYGVEFRLMQNGYSQPQLDSRPFELDTNSGEWKEWIGGKAPFVLLASDVGQEISVIEERERNFNKNLLREFLDGIPITLSIKNEDHHSIVDLDNYPMYFWDRAACISGMSHSSGEMLSIEAVVNGLESHPAIKVQRRLNLKYWHFLTEEQRPFMSVLLKWHKALIALYHLLKRDGGVDVPIDFPKLKLICWDEINAISIPVSKGDSNA